MNRKQFEAFMATLIPMKSHSDKAVNSNYRKILASGFRCNRKEDCYTDGKYKIAVFRKKSVMVWQEI